LMPSSTGLAISWHSTTQNAF